MKAFTKVVASAVAATPLLLGSTQTASFSAEREVDCGTYAVSAAADGVRTSVASPGLSIVESADVSAPYAQAHADGLGQSVAVAGAPYPGETLLSLLALGGVPQDSYPLTVSSQYPTLQASEREAPALHLAAHSRKTSSDGVASLGSDTVPGVGSVGRSQATASAGCSPSGVVSAEAQTEVDSLSFASGLVTIEAVRSRASVKTGPSGTFEFSSQLQPVWATVAGQTAEIASGGVTPPALTGALAAQGIALSYLEPTSVPGKSATSAGVEVVVTRQVTGTGPTEVRYTLGRATVTASHSDDAPGQFTTPAEPPANPDGASHGGVTRAGSHVPLPGLGAAPTSSVPQAAARPVPQAAVQVPASRDLSPTELASFAPPNRPLGSWYLVFMASGLLVILCGTVVRLFGVRLRWI